MEKCERGVHKSFLLENKINLNKIINFRNNINTKAEILNDQNYLSKINSERVKN